MSKLQTIELLYHLLVAGLPNLPELLGAYHDYVSSSSLPGANKLRQFPFSKANPNVKLPALAEVRKVYTLEENEEIRKQVSLAIDKDPQT